MIKKILVTQLKPKMFVSDLNCEGIPHGPKNKRGKIPNEKLIKQISQMGIKEVYIDTELGLDVKDGEPLAEVEKERQRRLEEASELTPSTKDSISVEDELNRARKVHGEAKKLIDNVLNNVKMGKNIQLEAIDNITDKMVDSVFRNKDALSFLGRIRNKNSYLLEHSVNLSVLMSAFGRDTQLDKTILKEISIGALLHDIGKILTPDDILNKPDKLTKKEFIQIQDHVINGKELLESTPGISKVSILVAGQHHEKIDGSGYPGGLVGNQISIYGRMCAVVDVYDAITSDRCYHNGITPSAALRRMLEWTDHHLDKELVNQFIQCIGIYPVGSLVNLNSHKLAIVLQQGEKSQKEPRVRIIYNTKQKSYTDVKDIDLAKPSEQDFVVGAADPRQYGIDIGHFINGFQ
ncbi:MAG: HD-GYP domain-containing protein [Pseudomonadales bacterium]|nr:HD-GYP domain-containing protein [Pseudomonadales bacterium]